MKNLQSSRIRLILKRQNYTKYSNKKSREQWSILISTKVQAYVYSYYNV